MVENLALVGYRGTGKSTVARRLAVRLGWSSADTDDEVETRAGATIAQLFATQGEAAFRSLESAVLAEWAARPRVVLATGGGVVMAAANRSVLATMGAVVWLSASPEVLLERLTTDAATATRRPRLTGAEPEQELRRLLAERAAWYAATADFSIDTSQLDPDEVAARILDRWAPGGMGGGRS